MSITSFFCFIWVALATTMCTVNAQYSPLVAGFYKSTCPSAEKIVKRVVNRAIAQNPALGAGLIRMHFHDCFVRGCDASILLDSTPGNPAEKDNIANNPSLRGYEVIDQAKAELESKCPQTVSCADIIAYAARDSASKLGGLKYTVQGGRRDGRISLKDDPTQNLPAPFFNLQQVQDSFTKKGLSVEEMVILSGAHSIGVSHCSSFNKRLYNFTSTNSQDPSLDPNFASMLKSKCPNIPPSVADPTIVQDFVTPNKLDNKYYQNVQNGKALFTSDQSLMTSPVTVGMVRNFNRQGGVWAKKFARAMVHMGAIEVLTGGEGEIRKNCRVVNQF
ncbi:peroxidase 5-like [Silene latifolia]|uniref:peroxidase 5-like n=1 Tax=Silene latifolia TaxID=37657 RepID=UPI003D77E9EC